MVFAANPATTRASTRRPGAQAASPTGATLMPMLPKRPCLGSGCRKLVAPPGRRCKGCETKRGRQRDAGRGEDKAFYKSAAWLALKDDVLREEPICRMCKRNASTVGEHIQPRHLRPDLELVRSNIQGACRSCANSKTAREDGGFGNARRTHAAEGAR